MFKNSPATSARRRKWTACAGLAFAAFAGAAALLTSVPARADIIWNFTYSGVGQSGDNIATGTLTTTGLSAGAYTILNASGTIDGVAIAGIAAAGGGSGSSTTDNLLYASGPQLDAGGFVIEAAAPNGFGAVHAPEQIQLDTSFNPVQGAGAGKVLYDAALPGLGPYSVGSFIATQVSPVPEPPAVALLLTGLLGIAVLRRQVA